MPPLVLRVKGPGGVEAPCSLRHQAARSIWVCFHSVCSQGMPAGVGWGHRHSLPGAGQMVQTMLAQGADQGAGVRLREAVSGRGKGQASLEGEDLPEGGKGPAEERVPWPVCAHSTEALKGLTEFHCPCEQLFGFPAPASLKARPYHLNCPQSLRGNAGGLSQGQAHVPTASV